VECFDTNLVEIIFQLFTGHYQKLVLILNLGFSLWKLIFWILILDNKSIFSASCFRYWCYVPYHHVTPDNITRPVRISRPDTTGTHPAARGMSGPFRKDLDNLQYFGTPSCAVGYSLYLGTTSDDTICLSFLIPTHMFFMIFYLMLFITISPDLFHLKHSFSIYTYLCLPVTPV